MRVTGLGRGLSAGLSRWRAPRAVHDPDKIVADLAAAVALAGTAWLTSRCCGNSRSSRGRWRPTRWCPGWSASWPQICRGPWRRSGPPGPRAAEPAAEGLRPEPAVVRDHPAL